MVLQCQQQRFFELFERYRKLFFGMILFEFLQHIYVAEKSLYYRLVKPYDTIGILFLNYTTTWQTDGQTDGWTYRT